MEVKNIVFLIFFLTKSINAFENFQIINNSQSSLLSTTSQAKEYVVDYSNIASFISEFDSSIYKIIWCGENQNNIIIHTELKSVYRSLNKGNSWSKMNNMFSQIASKEMTKDQNSIGFITKIIENPSNNNILYFLGSNGFIWVTDNCGSTISVLNLNRPISDLIPHPTEADWLLATAFTLCSDFEFEPCKIYKEVYISFNQGNDWEIVTDYVEQVDWAINEYNNFKALKLRGNTDTSNILSEKLKKNEKTEEIKDIPKERIYITHNQRGKGTQKSEGWNYKIDFVYSDDFFKTTKIGVHKGNKFLLSKSYIYVAQLIDQEVQEVYLQVANNRELNLNFQPIILSENEKTYSSYLQSHSFSFLETTDTSVFISIVPKNLNGFLGNIYVSDSLGINFSLSLEFNIHSKKSNKSDFSKLGSLDGIYIANSISKNYINQNMYLLLENNFENLDSKNKLSEIINISNDFIETYITFNKGGSWNRINPPSFDSNKKEYLCNENCFLNLFGIASDYPPFYSVNSAIGIIIANGIVGNYISYNDKYTYDNENDASEWEVATFISNDGGRNFREIFKGIHIYEIGNHGGIIVVAKYLEKTNLIKFSLDEGFTWKEYKFSDNEMHIRNIVIESQSKSLYFILYGDYKLNSKRKIDNVVKIDFSTLKIRQCLSPESPNLEYSDYETWIPGTTQASFKQLKEKFDNQSVYTKIRNPNKIPACILGVKMTYTRKKLTSQCFNNENLIKKSFISYCHCTEEDYECDTGYFREANNNSFSTSKCIKSNGNKEEEDSKLLKILNNCVGYYSLSQGYRKIPGNKCVEGVTHDPIIVPCSNQIIYSYFGVGLFCILAIILVILLYLAFNNNFVNNPTELRLLFSKRSREEKRFDEEQRALNLNN